MMTTPTTSPTVPPTAPTISLPDCRKPPAAKAATDVRGLRVRGTTVEYPLEARELTYYLVGTSRGCDIRLDDPYASSSKVAILWGKDGAFHIADNGSKNGTFVNGLKVTKSPIYDQAHIQIGGTHFIAFSDTTRHLLHPIELLVGNSPLFGHVRDRAMSAARARVNIVLIGQPGTGKTLLARAIHQESRAACEPYVEFDATKLDEVAICEALEAEPSAALGGTVYVHRADHLGEAGLASVIGLANRLEEPSIEATRLIVSTTEAAPQWAASLGTPLVLTIPPLRERALDVRQLVEVITRELSYGAQIEIPAVKTAALAGLDWPGNVAELRREVRRMVAEGDGRLAVESMWESQTEMHAALKRAIERAIEAASSRRAAAEGLGIPWSSFGNWVKKLKVKV